MGEYELAKDVMALQQAIHDIDYKVNLLLEAAGILKKEEQKKEK